VAASEENGLAAPAASLLAASNGCALWSGLDEQTLASWMERLRTIELGSGEVVFREGDPGRAMYVVLAGSVEMVKQRPGGGEAQLAIIPVGQWFGEMSLLDVQPRAVTARTSAAVRLLLVQPTDLEALYRANMKAYALLMMNIARQLSRRLRRAESALADAAEAGVDLYGERS
jgi:CRP/FNR family transcriptional regulator, cyclic AMP receptor protein